MHRFYRSEVGGHGKKAVGLASLQKLRFVSRGGGAERWHPFLVCLSVSGI